MTAGELVARLLDAIEGQAAALEADDFERFDALSDRRDELVAALGRLDATAVADEDHARLEGAGVLHARALAVAARLRQETAEELGSLRRGATAIHGYARPAANLAHDSIRLDQLR